jgi:Fe(3+) dicitrate transport protein
VSPGQDADVNPEESINYEAGARLGFGDTRAEAIGFFNQYSNLTGECGGNSGCREAEVGKQFNGGEVWVYGFESTLSQGARVPGGLWLQWDIAYTLTLSEFQEEFTLNNPLFGDIDVGDQLGYVPVHQGSAQLLLAGRTFDLATSLTFASAMRDQPGQDPLSESDTTDGYFLVDVVGSYKITEGTSIYLKGDNLLNQRYIASRRPFGARPGKPFSYMLGVKAKF